MQNSKETWKAFLKAKEEELKLLYHMDRNMEADPNWQEAEKMIFCEYSDRLSYLVGKSTEAFHVWANELKRYLQKKMRKKTAKK